MNPYTTSKSNLTAQELDHETLAALRLHPPEKKLQALLGILEKQEEDMDPTQQRAKEPTFKIGTKIKSIHTGKERTIRQVKTVGTQLVYITADGTPFNYKSLINHWTLVDKQEAK